MIVENYYKRAAALEGVASERRLRHQMPFLYKNIDFSGKTVVDIGGGIGLHSLYASVKGASHATIIEPEGDGGHKAMIATFKKLCTALDIQNVDLVQTTIQAFRPPEEKFDIVLIQDAINHFNEPACITLHKSRESWDAYDEIFRSISELVKPGGHLMMSDCSSKNLFPFLGLRNPFDLKIEWNKHQPPSVWAKVAKLHDLELTEVRWSTPARFGALGQALFGSSLASWFFTSHFVATFKKKG
jgi:2-polyprenyl-3-methyl-5-hydroxy-6-metoxy-1,4-benzoquinol methylase